MNRIGLDRVARVIGAVFQDSYRARAATGATIDSRQVKAGDLFFALPGTRTDGARFVEQALHAGAAGAVVAHGADLAGQNAPSSRILRVADPAAALRDLATFHRGTLDIPVIAVTGSCGKTTTRELVYTLLSGAFGAGMRSRKSYNNELGVPLTLLEIDRSHSFAVVEMGANRPGEIRSLTRIAKPSIGLITNIRRAHLEGFKDLYGVARAKGELFEELGPGGLAVFNPAEFGMKTIARRERLASVTFGAGRDCTIRIEQIWETEEGISITLNGVRFALPLVGARMAWNVAAAAAIGMVLGVDLENGSKAMSAFEGPPGRGTSMKLDGLTLIDDAYNANPSSMKAALEALLSRKPARRRVLVLGDMLELGRSALTCHMELGRMIAAVEPDLTIPVGNLVSATVGAMVARGVPPSTIHPFADTQTASEAIPDLLEKGDVVLLKASRALRFERIREAIESRFGLLVESTP